MKGSLKIGSIFGIPIWINYTWLIIFFFIAFMLAVSYFPTDERNWGTLTYWALGIGTSVLFFVSLLVHELAHSFICIKKGIPVKSITLFIFGGVAKISREADKPEAELMMALAGPLASLALSAIFWGLHLLLLGINEPLAVMANYLFRVNLVLAIFNMIPGYPLDGGRVFRSILWMINRNYKRATRIAAITGRIIGYLFVAAGVFIIIYLGWWVNGMWFAFIGWFLSSAAAGSYRQLEIRDSLGGITAADVMIRDYLSISPSLTVRQLHVYVMHTGQLFFLVTEKGSLMGSISADSFKAVPEQMWDVTTVHQIMTPAEQMQLIQIDDDAIGILEKMDDVGTSRAVVVDRNNGILGLITRDHMIRFAQVRSELGT